MTQRLRQRVGIEERKFMVSQHTLGSDREAIIRRSLGSHESVRKSGSPEVRKSGSPEVRESGSPGVRESGSPGVRKSWISVILRWETVMTFVSRCLSMSHVARRTSHVARRTSRKFFKVNRRNRDPFPLPIRPEKACRWLRPDVNQGRCRPCLWTLPSRCCTLLATCI